MSNKGSVDEEYEHWESQDTHKFMQPAAPIQGYDSHNGYRSHSYHPAGNQVEVAPKAEEQQPQMTYYQPGAMPMAYGPNPFSYPTQYSFSQPAGPTVSYLAPASPYPSVYGGIPIVWPVAGFYQRPACGPSSYDYIGRTKAEVEEDNMKIAAREGAYDKRKVVPIGVKDDQMMWVVELDGSHTLRTFQSIKELEGEWKKDPRFEDSYYFVREAPEEEEEGKAK